MEIDWIDIIGFICNTRLNMEYLLESFQFKKDTFWT